MYKVNVKQERFGENRLKFDKVKNSLPDAIDEEHRRINVDSSKKRACLQHMDYDGFHQMVLGANLIPIKKGSIEGTVPCKKFDPLQKNDRPCKEFNLL